jgi:pimeloyl-ACP methyl ester carboxylesterase
VIVAEPKPPVGRILGSKAAGSKSPAAKSPAAKSPAAKSPAAKSPAAKSPAAKRPTQKGPASKAAVAKTAASTAVARGAAKQAVSRAAVPKTVGPARNRAGAFGLAASVLALAGGGIALGLELERRIVSKRLHAEREEVDEEPFFSLRSSGPEVVTPDGVRLHTEVDELPADGGDSPAGPEDDLTLVLVHGYALSLDCWHFQRKHFRNKIRIVLYDQRSHGRSGRSAGELCRVPQLAEDLLQVLDEVVGDGPVVLVGHSMGGMTIMHLALTHPELFGTRIRGVALFSTAAGEMADYSPIRGLPGRTFGRIAQPTMAALNRIPEVVERGRTAGSDLSFVFTKKGSYGSDVPPSYVEFMNQMLGQTPMSVISDFYPAFAELDEYDAFNVLATVETAVIGGEDDAITPIRHTDKIIELLPGADVRRLPDCGHMGIIEHHEIFNQVLADLIARARRHLG